MPESHDQVAGPGENTAQPQPEMWMEKQRHIEVSRGQRA